MGDKFEGFVQMIVSLAVFFFLIKGVIPFLESIADRASLAQAKFEREKREAIRQAEERKKELEKERQIQEAKRKNPLYPAKPLRHIAYNDHETMRKILEELKANGKWPHKKRRSDIFWNFLFIYPLKIASLQFFSLHTRRRRLSETGHNVCFFCKIYPLHTRLLHTKAPSPLPNVKPFQI